MDLHCAVCLQRDKGSFVWFLTVYLLIYLCFLLVSFTSRTRRKFVGFLYNNAQRHFNCLRLAERVVQIQPNVILFISFSF